MKKLTCRDAGFDCDSVLEGNTDDEVMKKAREHGAKQHGIQNLNADQERDIRRLIKNA